MKKLLLVLVLSLVSLTAQARSVKLGYGGSSSGAPAAIGNAPTGNTCSSSAMCATGWKCASGQCTLCQAGDADCNCPLGYEAVGFGTCGCGKGTVSNGSRCVDLCDLTTCKAGYVKENTGTACCCLGGGGEGFRE